MLFSSNFKRFGKKSGIAYPLTIQNAKYIEIGDHVNILNKVWLVAMKIDDNTRIGNFSTISSVRNVRIGKNVLIADNVYISDNLHAYQDVTLPIMKQPIVFKGSVYIGDGSWIGRNVSIIGARIEKHCVVGANSVVTKDIPEYCVVVGSPARVIMKYNFKINEWQKTEKY